MREGKIQKILDTLEHNKELNSAKIMGIQAEYELITENEKLKEIKQGVTLVKSIKMHGVLLYILAFMGLIASTSLSLAGGLPYYTGMSRFAFITAICFVQIIIFFVSSVETIVKTKFNSHYYMFKTLQYGLLTVSIYYNYDFFVQHAIGYMPVTLLLCILLDVCTIKIISLAWDANRLNYSTIEEAETVGMFKAIVFNLLFKLKIKTLKQYKQNVETLKQEVLNTDSNTCLNEDLNTDSNVLNFSDKKCSNVEKIKTHLNETYKDGDVVNVNEIKERFKLSARGWQDIKSLIPELVSKTTKTYYVAN